MKDPRAPKRRKLSAEEKAANAAYRKQKHEAGLRLLKAWGFGAGLRWEYEFDAVRSWRFDWCWPEWKVALEVEGGRWIGKGHTAPMRFGSDMHKYNTAEIQGWAVLRCDPSDFRAGRFAGAVKAALVSKGWRG